MKKIVVIDGQGGRMGKSIIEQLKKNCPEELDFRIYALGTNSAATQAMIKGGADFGATGENPMIVNCKDADMIIGPIGILIADSLLGEITPKMAVAIGQSRAKKLLIPVNRCQHFVIGCEELPFGDYARLAMEKLREIRRG